METIGRYEVIRALGHGAMGRVFLARDPDLERLVALKLLHEHAAQEDAQVRFRDEAKALAALNHPGIVGIYEIGVHDAQDFIAMEYLPGRSLREVLQTANRVAMRGELLAICAKVAVAVAAAHRAGILHRDIKPENVVVTDAGDVKVVDFGIARRMTERRESRRPVRRFATPIEVVEDVIDAFMATMAVTQTDQDTLANDVKPLSAGGQTVFGTPGYMAPEVLTGTESSEASDVYSLGVMVYECVAGRRPYDAPSLVEVMAMVIDGSVPPEPVADRHWPLIERMLAREPNQRPGLDEVAAALAPAAPAPRAKRWPAVAIASAALVLGAVGTWRIVRSPVPPAGEAAPLVHATIVVEPMENSIPSYGAMPPTKRAISDVLATLLRNASGIQVTSVGAAELIRELGLPAPTAIKDPELTAADMKSVETRLGAYVVRGSINPREAVLHAHVVVSSPDGRVAADLERDRPVAELPKLMDDLADGVVAAIDKRAKGVRADKALAKAFAEAGAAKLANVEFYDARPLLEQAVDLDPDSFAAWYTLASVRSWMQAPEQDVKAAIVKALALAPAGVQKQFLEGVALDLDESFREALVKLAPLDTEQTHMTNTEWRDLLYYLGEAHYHLGHQAVGVTYFRRALERDEKFIPAMIHPLYYALGRRDAVAAGEISALMHTVDRSSVDFALGHYALLADHPNPLQLHAQLVLRRPPSPELVAKLRFFDRTLLDITQAIEAGDTTAEQRQLETLWVHIRDDHSEGDNTYFLLSQLAEVLICAGHVEPLRRVLDYLADVAKTKPVPQRARLMLLAAPLLHEHAAVVRAELTDRELTLADATDAELAGDHAHAAEVLQALVDDPTQSWNYSERIALLRNLRALHRTRQAKAVCTELVSPPLFHFALLTARMQCR